MKSNSELSHNMHACAIVLGKAGILIRGRSGSGKTSLCFGLIEAFKVVGNTANWVSDDQIFLEIQNNKLIAKTPANIAGKAELYGRGIVGIEWQDNAQIHLVVNMVDDDKIERMPEASYMTLQGLNLPAIEVPERHEAQSIRLVTAKLKELFG